MTQLELLWTFEFETFQLRDCEPMAFRSLFLVGGLAWKRERGTDYFDGRFREMTFDSSAALRSVLLSLSGCN